MQAFFCKLVNEFNENYPDFIHKDSEEADSEGEESGGEGEAEGDTGKISESEKTFRWLSHIDSVSETLRVSWDDVFSMNVYEFFNILSYVKEKNRRRTEEMKKWSRH